MFGVQDKAIKAEQLTIVARNLGMDAVGSAAWSISLTVLFTSSLPLVGQLDDTLVWSWAGVVWVWSLAVGGLWWRFGPRDHDDSAACMSLPLLCAIYASNALIWLVLIAYLFHWSGLPELFHPAHDHDLADMTHVTSRLIALLVMVGIAISYTIQQSAHRLVLLSCLLPLTGGTALLFFTEPTALSTMSGVLVLGIAAWLAALATKLNADMTHRMITDRDHLIAASELAKARDEAVTLKTAAEAASEAKSNFMATMSHEFRTPLNAIIGFSELMSRGYFPDDREKQIQYATDIHNSGRHLLALVEDVLDIQKIEGGNRRYEIKTIAATKTLDPVIPMLKEEAQEKGVAFRVEIPQSLHLFADGQSLKQITINLVANAIRHTPRGGTVTLHMEAGQGQVLLHVSDTGEGIDPDIADGIFEAFVTGVDTPTSPGHGGTGLGLTIANELVAAHKGRIWFETTNGQGTCFHVMFPTPAKRPSPPVGNIELHRLAP